MHHVQRHAFQLNVRPETLTAYLEAHVHVAPEMLEALQSAGWSNYSLYLSDGGRVFGVFERPGTFSAAVAAMERSQANADWQLRMKPLLRGGAVDLAEIFNLEAQTRSL